MKALLQHILDDAGIQVSRIEPVQGGDISRAYHVFGHRQELFLKVNNAASFPGMFAKEARGLEALQETKTIKIPRVLSHGISEGDQYLLLEWLMPGRAHNDFWEQFGAGMAMLHKQPQDRFGWKEDNYIGSLPQINTQHFLWHLFYFECRIMPLVKQLFDTGRFSTADITAAEILGKRLENAFPPEPPSLLHGDLWSGNFLVTGNGYAAIYDPGVYCGHREMDIGMTKLFGGFDERFYHAYNEVYPLETNWRERLPLTQLYPLLVHAVLFGGQYIHTASKILRT